MWKRQTPLGIRFNMLAQIMTSSSCTANSAKVRLIEWRSSKKWIHTRTATIWYLIDLNLKNFDNALYFFMDVLGYDFWLPDM